MFESTKLGRMKDIVTTAYFYTSAAFLLLIPEQWARTLSEMYDSDCYFLIKIDVEVFSPSFTSSLSQDLG